MSPTEHPDRRRPDPKHAAAGRATPRVQAIVTVPPYADFAGEICADPLVAGLRLNTVMPVAAGEHRAVLRRLAAHGKPLYIDLKARQLRVVGAAMPPFTEVRLSHPIRVRTPTVAWFADGREEARVVRIDGDRLLLADGPRRFVGPGESVNIPDPSLEVLGGLLTDGDRAWVEAARAEGLHDYMLSFVESEADVEALRALDPRARVVCKIESRKGLAFARRHGGSAGRLMAARGDLYVEVGAPHRVLAALRDVLAADPRAILASRLFPSLARGPVPDAQDIGDCAFLLGLGYRTFMLGDEVSLARDSALAALHLLAAIAADELRAAEVGPGKRAAAGSALASPPASCGSRRALA